MDNILSTSSETPPLMGLRPESFLFRKAELRAVSKSVVFPAPEPPMMANTFGVRENRNEPTDSTTMPGTAANK